MIISKNQLEALNVIEGRKKLRRKKALKSFGSKLKKRSSNLGRNVLKFRLKKTKNG